LRALALAFLTSTALIRSGAQSGPTTCSCPDHVGQRGGGAQGDRHPCPLVSVARQQVHVDLIDRSNSTGCTARDRNTIDRRLRKWQYKAYSGKHVRSHLAGGRMPDDIEKRIANLEKRLDAIVKDQNKVNKQAYVNVMSSIQAQNKVNQKAYDHITNLEKHFDKNLKAQNAVNKKTYDNIMSTIQAQNKVNQKAYDHITKLEKQFKKMEKRR
jgi:hypothetical protein